MFIFYNSSETWKPLANSYLKLKDSVGTINFDTMLRGLLHPSEYKKILFQVSQQPKVTYGTEKSVAYLASQVQTNRINEMREKIKAKKLSSQKYERVAKLTKATDVIITVNNLLSNKDKGTKEPVSDNGTFPKTQSNVVKEDNNMSSLYARQHRSNSIGRLRMVKNVVSAVSAFKCGLKPGTVSCGQRSGASTSESTNGSTESTR